MKNHSSFVTLMRDGKLTSVKHGDIQEETARIPFLDYEKNSLKKMHFFIIEQIGDYKMMSWTYGRVTQTEKDLHVPVYVSDAVGQWSRDLEFICYFNGTMAICYEYGERPIDAMTKDVRNFWLGLMGWS